MDSIGQPDEPRLRRSRLQFSLAELIALVIFGNFGCMLWYTWQAYRHPPPLRLLPSDTTSVDRGFNCPALFLPDGRRCLSGGADGKLRLWDWETGACLRIFVGHKENVKALAISGDGRTLLSGSYADGTLRLWNVETGACRREFKVEQGTIHAVALSPDGKLSLVGTTLPGQGWGLRLWGETSERQFGGHLHLAGPLQAVALSTDGRRALSGSCEGMLQLWDLETGECLWAVADGKELGGVRAAAFSPRAPVCLSGGEDCNLYLRDLETGRCLRVFSGHEGAVWAVAFSPDGRRCLSGSGDDWTLRLWDVATGRCLRVIPVGVTINSVAISPDGRLLLAGCGDGVLRLWLANPSPWPFVAAVTLTVAFAAFCVAWKIRARRKIHREGAKGP